MICKTKTQNEHEMQKKHEQKKPTKGQESNIVQSSPDVKNNPRFVIMEMCVSNVDCYVGAILE